MIDGRVILTAIKTLKLKGEGILNWLTNNPKQHTVTILLILLT